MTTTSLNAAAPELLAALKAMVASYDGLRDVLTDPTVLAKLKAADVAIVKAESHSPVICKNNGGPVFPEEGSRGQAAGGEGISVRDYLAAQALIGLSSGPLLPRDSDAAEIARRAYVLADAMLAACAQ